MEIKLNDRIANVELMSRAESRAIIRVDGKEYEADILMVEQDVYSVLLNGISFNIELIPGNNLKQYTVNTYRHSYEAEIIDAETRYRQNREKGLALEGEKSIISPMPGKVISILTKPGDEVKEGQTLIIISAMKMESEFKAKSDGIVTEVRVKENDTVDGKQVLIVME
ncbi:MAG: acetyl-CoA carboxylase biotin carboxyl carrier protein subunit [Bacteroidales bacterium]|nr:acetyl-CoA carboxylase biotin carboxyl carrier protein subunit [Bacteroidales bacterium]